VSFGVRGGKKTRKTILLTPPLSAGMGGGFTQRSLKLRRLILIPGRKGPLNIREEPRWSVVTGNGYKLRTGDLCFTVLVGAIARQSRSQEGNTAKRERVPTTARRALLKTCGMEELEL